MKTTEAKIFFLMMPLMLVWFVYLLWHLRLVELLTPLGLAPFYFIGALPLWMNALLILLTLLWGFPLLVFFMGRLVIATFFRRHQEAEHRETKENKKT